MSYSRSTCHSFSVRTAGFVVLFLVQMIIGVRSLLAQTGDTDVDVIALAAIRLSDPIAQMDIGQSPEKGPSSFTFYSVSNHLMPMHVRAALDAPLPDGIHLDLDFESTLGQRTGTTELTDAEVEVVRDLREGDDNDRLIVWTASMDLNMAFDFPITRTVTLSLFHPETGVWAEARQVIRIDRRDRMTAAIAPGPGRASGRRR